ncbi:hypothetical protein A3H19_02740 [Candidatus Woesebacteria bacterium RIFCSPLOWO2_12_FULL_39_9]|nr:MAG: hypothetical protein A3H19_02740 [Candidatus Woesebacteria bacterium RIFCSPLOWO2_12_FULL_39_9]
MNQTTKEGDFQLPDGVQKGRDFFGQGSIESTGERLAARIRSRMPDEKADLLIVDTGKAFFLNLPTLADEVGKGVSIWVPRYDSYTGAIYTTRWDTPHTHQTDRGRGIADSEKYQVISKPLYRSSVDLNSFPKSWTVARLVPQEVWNGLEAALRQQDEIRVDYGGGPGAEQQVVEDLLVGIRSLAEVFKEEEITENTLQEISRQTEGFLEGVGLASAREGTRKNLANAMYKSAELDRKDRVNPMISRVRLRSAYLQTVKREVVGKLIKEKSNNVFELLLLEREVTRDMLISVDEAADWFLNEYPVFINPDSFITRSDFSDAAVLSTVNSLRGLVNANLKQVKVAPYLAPARIAEVLLTEAKYKSRKEQIDLTRILGVVNMEGLMDITSCEDFIRRRQPHEAIERMLQAQGVIRASLEDSDNSVYTVFSSQ